MPTQPPTNTHTPNQHTHTHTHTHTPQTQLFGQAREDSRLVCTREKQIGSLRSVSKCATVAERRRAREASQQEMFEMGRHGTKIESN